MKTFKQFKPILFASITIFCISSCCSIKEYNKQKYFSGEIYVFADPSAKIGIIKFPVRGEDRKAIIYEFDGNTIFKKGDKVKFRIGHLCKRDIAIEVEKSDENIDRIYDSHYLIEMHHASNHRKKGKHTKRHLLGGLWESENVLGDDNLRYNLGLFEDQEGDSALLAIPVEHSIDEFFVSGVALRLFFNIEGTVTIGDEEYPKVDDFNINHSELPH